jgi:hypothetical protein
MTDEEWAFFEHFILAIRATLTCATSQPSPCSGSDFLNRQNRFPLAGLWEDILDALNQSRAVPDALQMVYSTVIRAHHQAVGANARQPSNTTSAVTNGATRLKSCSIGERIGGVSQPDTIGVPGVFLSAIALAALVIYWLPPMTLRL